MDYIIGRDANTSQLNISFGQQVIKVGLPGSVPMTVSRHHCQLSVDDDRKMSIKNLKAQNTTYVNGHAVESKSIKPTDSITLGSDNYRLDLSEVLSAIQKTMPKVVDIRPLKKVWDEYENFMLEHQVSTNKFYALASATGLFTMGAVVISFIPNVDMIWRFLMYAVAIILILSSVIKKWQDSKWPLLKKQKDLELHQTYVCPNCHQYLGKPYDLLIQGNCCPNCKAKFKK